MHPKKRFELIIEKPALKRACRVLEDSDVTGYTVLPCMAGYGGGNRWERGTDLSGSRDMVMIVSILDERLLGEVTQKIETLIGSHIGILSVSDVEVIRGEKF